MRQPPRKESLSKNSLAKCLLGESTRSDNRWVTPQVVILVHEGGEQQHRSLGICRKQGTSFDFAWNTWFEQYRIRIRGSANSFLRVVITEILDWWNEIREPIWLSQLRG